MNDDSKEFWKQQSKTYEIMFIEQREITKGYKDLIEDYRKQLDAERSKREDDVMYLKCAIHNDYCHIDDIHRCGALNIMET